MELLTNMDGMVGRQWKGHCLVKLSFDLNCHEVVLGRIYIFFNCFIIFAKATVNARNCLCAGCEA